MISLQLKRFIEAEIKALRVFSNSIINAQIHPLDDFKPQANASVGKPIGKTIHFFGNRTCSRPDNKTKWPIHVAAAVWTIPAKHVPVFGDHKN